MLDGWEARAMIFYRVQLRFPGLDEKRRSSHTSECSYRDLDEDGYTWQEEVYSEVWPQDPLVGARNGCLDTGPFGPSGESRYCKVRTW